MYKFAASTVFWLPPYLRSYWNALRIFIVSSIHCWSPGEDVLAILTLPAVEPLPIAVVTVLKKVSIDEITFAQEGVVATVLVACDMLSLAIAVSTIVKNPATKFASTVVPLFVLSVT